MTTTPGIAEATLSPWWARAVITTMAIGFAVLILLTAKAYQNAPPIPARAVDDSGKVVFTSADIGLGQQVFLKRFPVHADVSVVLDNLARTIVHLYPERVRTQIKTTCDSRIVVAEFSDHPNTTHGDVLRILTVAADSGGRRPVDSSAGC
jgi:hypothetical protein